MKTAILSLQCMGKTNRLYYQELEKNLRKYFTSSVNQSVKFFPVDYHSAFQHYQTELWERAILQHKKQLRQRTIRRFMLNYFSDAVTYETDTDSQNSVYFRVHCKIKAVLEDALAYSGNDGKVIIITHSLGGQVISNYIWDLQKSMAGTKIGIWKTFALPENDFLKLANLHFIFTSGCNIPLFVSGYDKIEAISKPSNFFEWHNYFDKNDVLGWPLKCLSITGVNGVINGYNEIVTSDKQINTGLWLLSHVWYWKKKSFYRKVAGKINNSASF